MSEHAASGKLVWGVKASFREYVRHAEGQIRLEGGAEQVDDVFAFAPAGEELKFTGAVHFDAHGGMLKVAVIDPWIELEPDGSASLTVADPQRDRRVKVADLGEISPAGEGTAQAPAFLTMDGVWLLGNVYAPRAEIDPVVFPWKGE